MRAYGTRMDALASAESLHRIRGRIDVALDIIGRCVVAYRPDASESSGRILEGLCLAARELAAVADTVDEELLGRLPLRV
jgi:hypothetical protein